MLSDLLDNNKAWADEIEKSHPGFFKELENQQKPEYLWIGCSDSRVPANEIVGLMPGELFVHRNIANMVLHTDLNCISVLHYAVDVLKVKHIIICGHYGCGGVAASLSNKDLGLIDNWIRHLKDIGYKHREELKNETDPKKRVDLMCELNVREQVANICHSKVVQKAWTNGQDLSVHGWIYGVGDGIIKDLGVDVSTYKELPEVYRINFE
ncbi:carbonate dehydratase [Amphritea balenae]|uniref:Carbonic anhydrase 2 n=1 Tax=Amphritea balenae TaxID=452629 RepID=A0A3P1STK1_9GAMM|nr:carbonate dehydratase [Amphritea balenae]RRD00471.1 carbonate dehydratase [Amphritea balenae]GGK70502.1 carbonic anhydrase [Amphritea balenae]